MRTEDWFVREVRARFELQLARGEASADDLAFIAERMHDCPVSRNLPGAQKETELRILR